MTPPVALILAGSDSSGCTGIQVDLDLVGRGQGSPSRGFTASLRHVLVQQHPEKKGERVPAEKVVGDVVLGNADGRHGRRSCRTHGRAGSAVP